MISLPLFLFSPLSFLAVSYLSTEPVASYIMGSYVPLSSISGPMTFNIYFHGKNSKLGKKITSLLTENTVLFSALRLLVRGTGYVCPKEQRLYSETREAEKT